LREAFILQPKFFNKQLLDATFIIGRRNYEDNWPTVVDLLASTSEDHRRAVHEGMHRHVTMRVDISVDGVACRKETAAVNQMTPIVGRLVALEVHDEAPRPKKIAEERNVERFVFARAPAYLVGYFIGNSKPPMQVISRKCADELIAFSPFNASLALLDDGTPETSIRTYRTICDGPARSDVKGSLNHGGYHSLPKCLTVGTRHGRTMKYPSSDCVLRVDEDWDKYKEKQVSSQDSGRPARTY
jgi:hypothetical protein